jgi:hypothetical protein
VDRVSGLGRGEGVSLATRPLKKQSGTGGWTKRTENHQRAGGWRTTMEQDELKRTHASDENTGNRPCWIKQENE